MKKNRKTFYLVALIVLILVSSASVQGMWTNYTSRNSINDIAVEGDYIWCATDGGVVRWDRKDGTYVKYFSGDILSCRHITAAAVDANNVKWFGTYRGVSSFDGVTWTIYSTTNGLANNHVYAVAVDADNVKWFGTDEGVSSFAERTVLVENPCDMPVIIDIIGNFPNPFNHFTTIELSLDTEGFVTLDIFNISGQKVITLFAENLTAGVHSVNWNGRDASGSTVSSGIYFCRLIMGDYVKAHRMVLVK